MAKGFAFFSGLGGGSLFGGVVMSFPVTPTAAFASSCRDTPSRGVSSNSNDGMLWVAVTSISFFPASAISCFSPPRQMKGHESTLVSPVFSCPFPLWLPSGICSSLLWRYSPAMPSSFFPELLLSLLKWICSSLSLATGSSKVKAVGT